MTDEQFADAKQLYKFAMARDAFLEVSKASDYLLQTHTPSDAPEYYALSVGIVMLYCRPFTNSNGIGRLVNDLVPNEFQDLHKYLLALRNQAFAHTDSSGLLPGHGKMIELRFHLEEGHFLKSFSSLSVIEPPFLAGVKELSENLIEVVMSHHKYYLDKLVPSIVEAIARAGKGKEFELNVEEKNGPLLFEREAMRHLHPIIYPIPDLD
jgi:hypothetical protein